MLEVDNHNDDKGKEPPKGADEKQGVHVSVTVTVRNSLTFSMN